MERYIESRALIIVLSILLPCFMQWHGTLDGNLPAILGGGMAFPLGQGVVDWLCSRAKAD